MNHSGDNNQVLVAVITPKHQWLFVVTVHLLCFQFHTGDGTFSFLCNIERNAVIVVFHTLLTAWIVHQMIEYCHIDTSKILMNLNPSFWRVLVYPTFLIHRYSMLNIGNRDDGMTIQITHLPACAVFLLDIPVCDLTFLLQSVLQSVVKALFDIESDFVKVNIHMGCNAVIVMNAHDIGVVFLYQTIFHSWVIGLPYLPNDFLAFLPELTALSSEYGDVEAGGASSAEIAAFVFKALTFLNLLVVTIYGIGWFLYMVRYFRALRRERPFLATLGEQYEQEVGSRREVLTYNALKTAGILFFAGLIFALPLWLDGLDFLPDFVSGILMVLAVLRLYKLYPKKCRPALISGILYTVAATAEWVYALVFRNGMTIDYHAGYYRSVSTILARHPEKLGSYFGLVGVGIAKCILYAVFLCLICSVFLPIVEEHTGVAFELSSAESEEKKRKIQNDLRRRLNVLRGLSSAAAGGGIFFRCFRMFAEQMWVEYSEIVFALALFVGFLVFLNRLEEGIDNKYYLEK